VTREEERAIEHDCARLIAAYANFNDAHDWDQVAGLFAPDGRLARPTAPEDWIEGREAILAAFKARPNRATRHICANIVVTVIGDSEASAESSMLLFLSANEVKVGSFRDRFRKGAAGWQFSERQGSLTF